MMLRDLLRLNRPESSQAYMQGDKRGFYTLLADLLQQFIGKMQAGCRCGSGSHFPAVNSLIPLLIRQFCLDIGWQRHLAQTFQNFKENPFIPEFHNAVSIFLDLCNNSSQFSVTKDHFIANLHLPSGFAKALPLLIAKIPQKQDFHSSTCGSVAQKPCRQNAGIVHYQTVTGLQVINNIVEMFM